MAFGGEAIDNYGVVRPFPAASMLTGLLANALGWYRIERERHQRLQDRLVFAARIDRESYGGLSIQDFQTAKLDKNDKGWTTMGSPEGRAGGASTYNAPHLRFRDYYADASVVVALRLEPEEDAPTLEDLKAALESPRRPLFIGRKSCLPSVPIFKGFIHADTCLAALVDYPSLERINASESLRILWPQGEEMKNMERVKVNRTYMITDQRNWKSGLHGGGRWVTQGTYTTSESNVEIGV